MSLLLVLLCINMIVECSRNYFYDMFTLVNHIHDHETRQAKSKNMCHSDLLQEARNLLHLVGPWCGIL